MCGILALFGIENSHDMREFALQLSKLLRHRGPDWNGIYIDDNVILCHERLTIIGLKTGAQPIKNKLNNTVLAVNGEIYNYISLKKSLEHKYKFTTDSDCEVLLHLYQEYGANFLEKVEVLGMFSFIIYDSIKREFIVCRDHIGIIPLYIGYGNDGTICFSSELKALHMHCQNFELFKPGHIYHGYLDKPSNNKIYQYYNKEWYNNFDLIPSLTTDNIYIELRNQLTKSVKSHLISEVPYGVLLSGGLDSSLVASIASREYKKLKNVDVLRSFCIGLKGSPDIIAAEKVANFLQTKHYSFEYTIEEGLDVLSEVIYHLETFDVTTIRASTPMYLMARKIKATGVKMVLSGEGADEIFAGYLYFHYAPNKEELHKEVVRKVKDLHKYDCLRANKSMMAWGVEPRVPFLDTKFLEFAMNINPKYKLPQKRFKNSKKNIEKYLLRKAFDTEDKYLPEEILWRQKEQFSDGVGHNWIDTLKLVANKKVSDLQMKFASSRFPIGTPTTKEGYMYREIFSKHFPSDSAIKTVPVEKSIACSTGKAIEWHETFKNNADPSGRAILIHNNSY